MSHDTHRWSGWPGAYCMNCGIDDPLELCIGMHSVSITCKKGHAQCDHPAECSGLQTCTEPEHTVKPCPAYKGGSPYDPQA